jgi:ABC-type glycerol-3-phosphate transport system permease component
MGESETEVTVRNLGRAAAVTQVSLRHVTIAGALLLALIAVVPVLAVALVAQRRVVEGLTLGAVR